MSIEAEGLFKRFGGRVAVRDLSLRVEPGEVYGLIGPNGAGKTTTQRMLVGLMEPDAGVARLAGFDVVRQRRLAKGAVGFLTGTTGLYSRLTVAELLRYFGRLSGCAPAELEPRIAELAAALRFEALLPRLCGKLSTGERQRVSLARAVVHDPPVLVLDEPTAGLDVLASRFVAEFIRKSAARGRAVLFSTHYMTEAELLCGRVGCLFEGELIWQGEPAALRREQGAASLEEAFLRLIAPREGEGGAAEEAR